MNGHEELSIGTHDGRFHADEVVGCFLLRQLPEYKDAKIVRSRNPTILEKCDVVIDVGGVYNHYKKRYDHHQRDFCETLNTVNGMDERIKLSSAGLVFAHYGKDIINEITECSLTLEEAHMVYQQMYTNFVKEIDAKDNGIDAADPPFRYRISTDLASRIGRMNANVHSSPSFDENEQFMKAYDLAGKEFIELLDYTIKVWLPARGAVSDALNDRLNVHLSQRIIKLNTSNVSWPAHLKALEDEKNIVPEILFVLFPDTKGGWRVQAVSKDGSFDLRQKILPKCIGLRDEELTTKCGVKDAYFVHMTGFIGGACSYEGALEMAVKSLPKM